MGFFDDITEGSLRDGDSYFPAQNTVRRAIFTEPLDSITPASAVTVSSSTPLADAIDLMNASSSEHVLAEVDGRCVGILTDRDLRKSMDGEPPRPSELTVGALMKAPALLPASSSVAFGLRKMAMEGYPPLVLLDARGRIAGVLSAKEIVVWLVESFPETIHNLPLAITFPRAAEGA